MPELPEVETIRRDLSQYFSGLVLDEIAVFGKRTLRRSLWTSQEIAEALEGLVLVEVTRYGKFILIGFGSAATNVKHYLVVHLGMSGRFVRKAALLNCENDHTKLRLRFGAQELVFWDPRTFGEVFLEDELDQDGRPGSLSMTLGVDPIFDPKGVSRALFEVTKNSKRPIKSVLLDQGVVAGLGNIYSDEVLFRAHVKPTRRAGSLNTLEIETIVHMIQEVLNEAISMRGSSLNDKSYLDLAGLPGEYQQRVLVYGRHGKACGNCGSTIVRVQLCGRYSSYCQNCQR